MTDILTVLPDFDAASFAHIIAPLERALLSTVDILTLDALEVAARAHVPPKEVKRLTDILSDKLSRSDVGRDNSGQRNSCQSPYVVTTVANDEFISTLDAGLDTALQGGVAVAQLTEFTGESATGKTQFLLTLLLAVQLSPPLGLSKSALYISTEAPLQTTRLAQILRTHPRLHGLPNDQSPSLDRVQSTHTHDLEAQEHILRYQVPVIIERGNIGLVVVDSIAANYRAEFDRGKARKGSEALAKRGTQLAQLAVHLRSLAWRYGVAVVVANQVSDRFLSADPLDQAPAFSQSVQRPIVGASSQIRSPEALYHPGQARRQEQHTSVQLTDDPLSFDHQQRFFTGWGDDLSVASLKTPSLGLSWTNQLATRIALHNEPILSGQNIVPGTGSVLSGRRRRAKIVFSSWCPESETDFEIWKGGVRASTSSSLPKYGDDWT